MPKHSLPVNEDGVEYESRDSLTPAGIAARLTGQPYTDLFFYLIGRGPRRFRPTRHAR